ncbi:MAG TPA: MBL fold metallo-hydrolase [Candidatus Bathyarchaeia archaeon]|nr:MBL fold metallo-hydrolase [Candidatus Bathyarchaeia archaeon]
MKQAFAKNKTNPFIIILGIAQDGGVPHCGCNNLCCRKAWGDLSVRKNTTSLAIIDPQLKKRWLIETTPDFKFQLALLNKVFPTIKKPPGLEGIFLTHGHIGHYTGLLCLEKAILNAQKIPVFVMPKMKIFLLANSPWKDLIQKKNIKIKQLQKNQKTKLNKHISILPFLVNHRDEYTETVGFVIEGPNKKVLFIPDIDKWEFLKNDIKEMVRKVDLAFLDGTFFDQSELSYRNIKEIPHPLISESIKIFSKLPLLERRKIYFIHFNHTNPVLNKKSKAYKQVIKTGFQITEEGTVFAI